MAALLATAEACPPTFMSPMMERSGHAQISVTRCYGLPSCKTRELVTPDSYDVPGVARVFDSFTGERRHVLRGESWIHQIAWSPDGRKLVAGGDGDFLQVFDVETGKEVAQLRPGSKALSVAWHPTEQQVVVGCYDKGAFAFDLRGADDYTSRMKHGGPVRCVAYQPLGEGLATGSDDKLVRIFDCVGQQLFSIPHKDTVGSIAWRHDGCRLVTGCDDFCARIIDTGSGAVDCQLKHPDAVRSVSFHPAGVYVATGCNDRLARVWDSQSGAEEKSLRHGDQVHDVAFSPDGQRLATGCLDKLVKVFDITDPSWPVLKQLRHEYRVSCIAWQPQQA
eukprot:TRINITY_DN39057_c0_g1_i2.p1 TRINITY_DN39057_c0_g1~~TRINITY_DN39057_c0_g1_i2.p1  ORF type:complete len:361 (+),score=44.75 TRINITY_DN39057_c0_g1_i2:80-1084(+)